MSDNIDEPDKEKVTPIWSRLEKILAKTESHNNTPPVDIIGFISLKLQIERTALELSIMTVTDHNGRTTHHPPNLKLAETLSNYIQSRLGLAQSKET